MSLFYSYRKHTVQGMGVYRVCVHDIGLYYMGCSAWACTAWLSTVWACTAWTCLACACKYPEFSSEVKIVIFDAQLRKMPIFPCYILMKNVNADLKMTPD
jgi:hypothetical protein